LIQLVRRLRRERHTATSGVSFTFGHLNVRSLDGKLDDVLETRRDLSIDVLFLGETFHDADSVCIRRLRADGFQVVERARPRSPSSADSVTTNYGGVAVVAVPGVRLTMIDVGVSSLTFEFVCVRITSGTSACIAVLIYRPGSVAVTQAFFSELSDLLDRVATMIDSVFVVGDLNVHVERPDDPAAKQLNEVLASHDLVCRVNVPTQRSGGTLDIVATSGRLPSPSVEVLDIGLLDNCLLRWSASLVRSCPVYSTEVRRP